MTSRAILLGVIILFIPVWGYAHSPYSTISMTLDQMVYESDSVVVARLVTSESRWNDRGDFIFTDYHFVTEECVVGACRSDIVITQPGGRIGDLNHALSVTVHLDEDQQYLLFVEPAEHRSLVPFVGAAQGVHRITEGGMIRFHGEIEGLTDQLVEPAVENAMELLRDSEKRVLEAPPPALPSATSTKDLPSKRFVPSATRNVADDMPPEDEQEFTGPEMTTDYGVDIPVHSLSVDDSFQDELGSGARYSFNPNMPPELPIVFDQFPPEWSPWAPVDQQMMARWNRYGGDVFRVRTEPSDTFEWGNDEFEMAGFQSDAELDDWLEREWGSTIALAAFRWYGDGPIAECVIAYNDSVNWSLDEELAAQPGSLSSERSFRYTTLHELGHCFSLRHPWEHQDVWWPSVMNYAPKRHRIGYLHADDTEAIRSAYGDESVDDASVAFYRVESHPDWDEDAPRNPRYFRSLQSDLVVYHGDSFSLDGRFTYQNLGTSEIIDPTVEAWLSENRMTWAGRNIKLAAWNYSTTVDRYTVRRFNGASLTVGNSTHTGKYYMGLHLPDDDDFGGNNSAWSDADAMVEIRNNPMPIATSSAWNTTPTGYIGPDGDWTFEVFVHEGHRYFFSLCDEHPGQADFWSQLSIHAGGDELQWAFLSCPESNRPLIDWVSDRTGWISVTATGSARAQQGSFQLAYRSFQSEIFFDRFE